MATIQGIYLAFFGRPADPAGLAYWNEVTGNGADLSILLGALSGTQEYQQRFQGATETEVIASVYETLFGRAPEPEGLAFFVDALSDGTQSIASIAVNILDGAQGDDAATITNRIEAANTFTASLDTPAKVAAYSGAVAIEKAQALLSVVTSDPATIPTQETISQTIDTIAPPLPTPDAPTAPPSGSSTGPSHPPGYFDPPDRPDIYVDQAGEANGEPTIIVGHSDTGVKALLYSSTDNTLLATLPLDGNGIWSYPLVDSKGYSVYVVIQSEAGVLSARSNITVIGSTGNDVLEGANLENPDYALAEVHGRAGNDTIRAAASGNTLYGGEGDDHLIGNPNAYDQFYGGRGADIIEGGTPTDGSDSIDDVWYNVEGGPHGVIIDLQEGWAKDSFIAFRFDDDDVPLQGKDDYVGIDTLSDIMGIGGTNFDDILIGHVKSSIIRPYLGNDIVIGGGRADLHYGNGSIARVDVDLSTGIVEKYAAVGWDMPNGGWDHIPAKGFFTDTVSGIERVRGSTGADKILGHAIDNNRFRPLQGNDEVDGGGGINTIDYYQDIRYGGRSGVEVKLIENYAIDGFGNRDTLRNIQNVIATDQNDLIVGNTENNRIEAMGGDDILDGISGSDILIGGNGNDVFVFRTILSSQFDKDSGGGHSYILDFRADGDDDKIRLGSLEEDQNSFQGNASGEMIEKTGTLSLATFEADVNTMIGAEIGTGVGEHFAALVTATGGTLNGSTFLIVDNGDGEFSIATDLVIELTGASTTTGPSVDWFAAN